MVEILNVLCLWQLLALQDDGPAGDYYGRFSGRGRNSIRVLGTVKASEVPEVGIVAKAQMTLMTFSVVDSTVELKGLEMIGISETDYQIRLHLGTGIFFLMSCENSNSMN